MVLLLALCATAPPTLDPREIYLVYLFIYYLRDTYCKVLPSAGHQRIPVTFLIASYCSPKRPRLFVERAEGEIQQINREKSQDTSCHSSC